MTWGDIARAENGADEENDYPTFEGHDEDDHELTDAASVPFWHMAVRLTIPSGATLIAQGSVTTAEVQAYRGDLVADSLRRLTEGLIGTLAAGGGDAPTTGHPRWCNVVEAHSREDCRRVV
jgi:hypothetical protein